MGSFFGLDLGSSQIKVRLFVFFGISFQVSGVEKSFPSQVYSLGIVLFSVKAELVKVKAMAFATIKLNNIIFNSLGFFILTFHERIRCRIFSITLFVIMKKLLKTLAYDTH